MKEKLKILELFGGIGACSKALERLNIDHKVVDYVEIDKYAVKSYNAIHNTNFEPQDITQWDKDIEVDLIMHGSPCQDFSLAGKQAGGDKDSGTRSSLLYETVRIVAKLKPKYVIWENVKNVISKKHRHNFDNYLSEMEQLGYANYYQVLNAKDYGIPQNRERVFTISIRNDFDEDGIEILDFFDFPPKQELKLRLKDMLEDEVDEKYYLNNSWFRGNFSFENKTIGETRYDEGIRTFKDNMCGSLRTIDAGGNKCVIIKEATKKGYKEAYEGDGVYDNLRIRKLTPLECWRLMGFDDSDFEKASQVCSNSQLYKQAGNSIVVNVLEEIFKELFKEDQQ
jgi:DNA (cytosine-5)-methyltransferase 1